MKLIIRVAVVATLFFFAIRVFVDHAPDGRRPGFEFISLPLSSSATSANSPNTTATSVEDHSYSLEAERRFLSSLKGFHSTTLTHIYIPFFIGQIPRLQQTMNEFWTRFPPCEGSADFGRVSAWRGDAPNQPVNPPTIVIMVGRRTEASENETWNEEIDQEVIAKVKKSILIPPSIQSCFHPSLKVCVERLTSEQDNHLTGSRILFERLLQRKCISDEAQYVLYMEPDVRPVKRNWLVDIMVGSSFPNPKSWAIGTIYRGSMFLPRLEQKYHMNFNGLINLSSFPTMTTNEEEGNGKPDVIENDVRRLQRQLPGWYQDRDDRLESPSRTQPLREGGRVNGRALKENVNNPEVRTREHHFEREDDNFDLHQDSLDDKGDVSDRVDVDALDEDDYGTESAEQLQRTPRVYNLSIHEHPKQQPSPRSFSSFYFNYSRAYIIQRFGPESDRWFDTDVALYLFQSQHRDVLLGQVAHRCQFTGRFLNLNKRDRYHPSRGVHQMYGREVILVHGGDPRWRASTTSLNARRQSELLSSQADKEGTERFIQEEMAWVRRKAELIGRVLLAS